MKRSIYLMVIALLIVWQVEAQINTPQPSPLGEVSQTVGLAEVSIEYSRPGVKGRKIFGGLEAYDKLWRTGANMATKLTVSDEVMIEGNALPEGEYALFSIPGEEEWTMIVNKNVNQGGTGNYDEGEDMFRFTVPAKKIDMPFETLTFMFSDLTNTGAKLHLVWENTMVSFGIEDPNVDKNVMAQIEEQMADPGDDPNMYYAAANYYFNADKDMEQAQEWIDKAVELNSDRYWVVHLQAKIHEKNGSYESAMAAAKKSKELAEENGNQAYVKMNDELMATISDQM
ncbi:DUF2911 domain-containing protein [Tunicatimonas pelagia]|uniref:DUF2911 domain-containing protein n=1 Tax=Tunicatimonas pelagia TaxID=931531 RepID=UPI002665A26C|nr:DUF2911 domain-containing protein [Tunicatimonas pelagia]WKN41450.1 DUF2911 domain-containing protein [Tunicatimonas pelagia]